MWLNINEELVCRKGKSYTNRTYINNAGLYLYRIKPMWKIEVRRTVNIQVIVVVARNSGKNQSPTFLSLYF
jgi:hypothetical protein